MRRRFMLAFTLLALPLLLLVVIANAFIVTPLTDRSSIELERRTLALYRTSLDQRLAFFDQISKIIMQDKLHMERLSKKYGSLLAVTLDYLTYFNKYPDTYKKLNENLMTVRFYVNNPTLNKDNSNISDISKLQAREALYDRIMAETSGKYIHFEPDGIHLYRVMNYITSRSGQYPVLELVIHLDELRGAVGSDYPKETVFVVDDADHFILLSGDAGAEDLVRSMLALPDAAGGIAQGNDAIVLYDDTSIGWRVIKLVTPSAAFTDATNARELINVLALMSAGVTMALILIVSRSISVRMRRLTDKIMAVHQGQYQGLVQIGGRDEISAASRATDELAKAINEMIETEYKWKLANTQLQLDLAYARINPHFLYNTLDAIDFYVRRGEAVISIDLIHSLAAFYRKSLNLGSEVVTVADELAHLESYLFIEQKMNDTVRLCIDVPDALRETRINALTLQPIVENSIQHGPHDSGRQLHIEIRGRIEGDSAVLTITDDGVGISESFARTFNAHIDAPSGVGLANVHARIRMRFGEGYGLVIAEKSGPGAEVRIVLPLSGG